jgi:hypothetical protein
MDSVTRLSISHSGHSELPYVSYAPLIVGETVSPFDGSA